MYVTAYMSNLTSFDIMFSKAIYSRAISILQSNANTVTELAKTCARDLV